MPVTNNLPFPTLHSKISPSGRAVNQSSITLTIGFICGEILSMLAERYLPNSEYPRMIGQEPASLLFCHQHRQKVAKGTPLYPTGF